MIELTLAQIREAVEGELLGDLDPDAVITGAVVHDSRQVTAGDLYVAIVGETHDGHEFVADALAAGALAAIVERDVGSRSIVVSNTLAALGRLARTVVTNSNVAVFGITGSSGKTSTKDLLGQVLATSGPTIWPPGSFNNEIGLPMTALQVTADTANLVLEFGARAKGDINTLTGIVRPDISIVTNVGSAHVGEFGSQEAIAEAKSELVAALTDSGVAVLNRDDPNVAGMAAATTAPVRWYGMDDSCHVQVAAISLDDRARPTIDLRVDGEPFLVRLPLSGAHQAMNAAAVVAAATAAGMSAGAAAEALEHVSLQSRWRMEISESATGNTIINDAYNANPESMAAAMRALASIGSGGRTTWAVLGEMRELGDESMVAHDELGRLAVRLGIDHLVGVGAACRPLVLGAASEGYFGGEAYYAEDKSAARAYLLENVRPGDALLFKASRAVGLEELAEQVLADQGGSVDASEVLE